MADESRIMAVLEQILDTDCSPEEACRETPELLPLVRARLDLLRAVEAEVVAAFPPRKEEGPTLGGESRPLPKIPGYDVQESVGCGGMGVVYKARQLKLNRLVAIKMLLAGGYAGPRESKRFKREAEAIAALRHPNIVQVFDAGDHDGFAYFTMEYMEGGSLRDSLAGAPQTAMKAAESVETLARAVHAAHQSGIVHRDLKPANVLLTSDGTMKIADFGLARRLQGKEGATLTLAGAHVGTPSYMSPEQALGAATAYGPCVDVYALGAILYEMLTGRPPFRGETVVETERQVLSDEPVPPMRLNPRTPRDLQTICLNCLHKSPLHRYASALDLVEDLARFRAGEPIRARRAGLVERAFKWIKRRPTAAGLLAAVILLMAAGAATSWSIYLRRMAAHAHQTQINQQVRNVVESARGSLKDGWQAADVVKLTGVRAEAIRAVDIARSAGASVAVQQNAEAFQNDAADRLDRAMRDRTLLETVLDVSAQEPGAQIGGSAGQMGLPVEPSVNDQYIAAFRQWGLDVDATAEETVVERLRQEPDAVVQELIAGLNAWMMARRQQNRPEREWRRLLDIADWLDRSSQHQRLRSLLISDGSARAETAVELAKCRKEIDPEKERALTVVLLAQASAAAGDHAGAEQILRQAATAQPNEVVLLSALGQLLERQKPPKLEEAIGYYRAARSLRRNLGVVLSQALVRAGRATEGEQILQELIHQQPESPAFHSYLGVNLWRQKKLVEAVTAIREAIRLKPDFAEAYSNFGGVLNNQLKFDEAEAATRKAIALKPDLAEAYNFLGNALQSGTRKYVEAEAAYRKATQLQPDFSEAYNNLGGALYHQGRYSEAEAAFRKASELKPELVDPYSNLGNSLYAQGKKQEAEAAYREAIKLKPDFALSHYNLAILLFDRQNFDEAELAYRKTIELAPNLAEAHTNLGEVLAAKGKYGPAESSYRKAIELKVDLVEPYILLGTLLMRQSRFVEAVDWLKRAAKLCPDGGPDLKRTQEHLQQCDRFTPLDGRLRAVLEGSDKPTSAEEHIEFARFCMFKKLTAASAHFFADAYAMTPKLADDPDAGQRFDAACEAALAGCGQGEDASKLDDAERSHFRADARRWLNAELDRWASAPNNDAKSRSAARAALSHWRNDPDLAGVRDPNALEQMSKSERDEFLAIWKRLDTVLLRYQEHP